MKLPAKIKVGGHWLKVELISEKQVQYDKMGTICHWENRIIIQKDLVESKRISSLFHEVLHELDKQNCLDLVERQVSAISEGFYTFLIDNELLKP